MTPLNEWSFRRRDLYLTTHNNHNRQTSMPPTCWGFLFTLKNPTASAGFEPANLGSKGQHATSRPPKPLPVRITGSSDSNETERTAGYGVFQSPDQGTLLQLRVRNKTFIRVEQFFLANVTLPVTKQFTLFLVWPLFHPPRCKITTRMG